MQKTTEQTTRIENSFPYLLYNYLQFLPSQETKKAAKLIKDRFGIDEVEEWLEKVDFDGDGVLSYEEFKMCFMENISAMQQPKT